GRITHFDLQQLLRLLIAFQRLRALTQVWSIGITQDVPHVVKANCQRSASLLVLGISLGQISEKVKRPCAAVQCPLQLACDGHYVSNLLMRDSHVTDSVGVRWVFRREWLANRQ